MANLSLVDALALLFVALGIVRGRSRPLGESLHALTSLLLVIALFLGFRLGGELRQLLGGVVQWVNAVPGLGSKLLVIVGAWLLMRLLRDRSAEWIGGSVPARLHPRITPLAEGVRAALLAGFLAWLAEGWFDGPPQATPWLVQGVRSGDAWVARMVSPAAPAVPTRYPAPPPWQHQGNAEKQTR